MCVPGLGCGAELVSLTSFLWRNVSPRPDAWRTAGLMPAKIYLLLFKVWKWTAVLACLCQWCGKSHEGRGAEMWALCAYPCSCFGRMWRGGTSYMRFVLLQRRVGVLLPLPFHLPAPSSCSMFLVCTSFLHHSCPLPLLFSYPNSSCSTVSGGPSSKLKQRFINQSL